MAAIFLTMAGVYGIGNGVAALSSQPALTAPDNAGPELIEAVRLLHANPHGAALGATNIVVSAMLIIASMMVTTRRSSAMWFVRQAILANLVFIGVRAGVDIHYLWSLGEGLAPLGQDAVERTQELLPNAGPPPNPLSVARSTFVGGEAIAAFLSASIHLYLGYRATRPAVSAFVDLGPR